MAVAALGIALAALAVSALRRIPGRMPSQWVTALDGSLVNLRSVRYSAVVDVRDNAGNTAMTKVVMGWSSTPALDVQSAVVVFQGRRPECEKVQADLARRLNAVRI